LSIRIKTYRYIFFLAAVAIVSIFIFISGCAGTSNSLKIMKVNNNVCKYSFQYSGSYKKDGPRYEGGQEDGYCYLGLFVPRRTISTTKSLFTDEDNESGTITYTPGGIEILVYDTSMVKEAKDSLYGWLKKAESDIDILDLSQISILGVKAEQIIYERPAPFLNVARWQREIYFNSKGLNWHLSVYCDKDLQESLSTDFDYILNTFKIH